MLVSILTSWFGARAGVALARVMPYVVGALLVVGVVLYLRWDAYNDGVADTTTRYEQLIQEERLRVQEANQAALNEANARIAELQRLLSARNAELLELQLEAAEDPDADRPAIGAGSVQRLNRIR